MKEGNAPEFPDVSSFFAAEPAIFRASCGLNH